MALRIDPRTGKPYLPTDVPVDEVAAAKMLGIDLPAAPPPDNYVTRRDPPLEDGAGPEVAQSPEPLPDASKPPLPVHDYALTPKDFAPELAKARAQSDHQRSMAHLLRAGAMVNSSLVGSKLDDAPYAALESEAGLPEQRVIQDEQMQRMASAARQAQDKADPASRTNRAAQVALRAAAPMLAKQLGPAIDNLTVDMIQKYLPMEDVRTKEAQAAKQFDVTSGEAHRHNLEAEAAKREENAIKAAGKNGQGLSPAADAVNKRFLQREMDELGKTSAPTARLKTMLDSIEAMNPGVTRGTIDESKYPLANMKDRLALRDPSGVMARLADDRAVKYKTQIDMLADFISRDLSGAVLNKQESDYYANLLKQSVFGDARRHAAALNEFRKGLGARLEALQSPKRYGEFPEAFDRYSGLKYTDPLFQDAPAAGGGTAPAQPQKPVTVTSKNPPKTVRNPRTGEVLELQPDGTYAPSPTKK